MEGGERRAKPEGGDLTKGGNSPVCRLDYAASGGGVLVLGRRRGGASTNAASTSAAYVTTRSCIQLGGGSVSRGPHPGLDLIQRLRSMSDQASELCVSPTPTGSTGSDGDSVATNAQSRQLPARFCTTIAPSQESWGASRLPMLPRQHRKRVCSHTADPPSSSETPMMLPIGI